MTHLLFTAARRSSRLRVARVFQKSKLVSPQYAHNYTIADWLLHISRELQAHRPPTVLLAGNQNF